VSTLTDRPIKLTLRTAMEARDLAAAQDAFTPDAVVRSPLTGRLTFNGREQIGAILQVILDVFDDLHYTDELHSDDGAVLVASARLGGTDIEMVDHMQLDENGKIRELTVFFRPLPAIAVAMRLIGAGLGRRKSRARAGVISALTRPLGLMTALGDRIGVWLVRPTL
jgi:ketosteroid isomerase-like protein